MKKQRLIEVSPLILGIACILLTVIIAVFAINNYTREKQLMIMALVQKGDTITRFIASSTKSTSLRSLREDGIDTLDLAEHLQDAIDHASDQSGTNYIYAINKDGVVVASSKLESIGKHLSEKLEDFAFNSNDSKELYQISTRDGDNVEVFHSYRKVKPFNIDLKRLMNISHNRRGMHRERSELPQQENLQQQLVQLSKENYVLLIELDLEQMNNAVTRQLYQIIALSLVLLLVGIGGGLSIITLQGLRGSQLRLRKAEAFTDLLVSSLPIGLVATDNKGKVQVINQTANNVLEIGNDVIGENLEDVLPVKLKERLFTDANVANQQFDLSYQNKVGDYQTFHIYRVKVSSPENEMAGDMLLFQDITELKKLETDLQRSERFAALGKVAAGVAHELRNPLSSIKGLALLLKPKLKDIETDSVTVDVMIKEVDRLNRSISELLDFARPEKLIFEKIDLYELVVKASNLLSADAKNAGIDISIQGVNKTFVQVDPDKLNQVLLNLLLNSIQAMDIGGEVIISLKAEDNVTYCTIEDSGHGIREEDIAKIFDPYFTTKNDGTGLGLAISAKIIEEHGGSLEIKSKIDKGTTAVITLQS